MIDSFRNVGPQVFISYCFKDKETALQVSAFLASLPGPSEGRGLPDRTPTGSDPSRTGRAGGGIRPVSDLLRRAVPEGWQRNWSYASGPRDGRSRPVLAPVAFEDGDFAALPAHVCPRRNVRAFRRGSRSSPGGDRRSGPRLASNIRRELWLLLWMSRFSETLDVVVGLALPFCGPAKRRPHSELAQRCASGSFGLSTLHKCFKRRADCWTAVSPARAPWAWAPSGKINVFDLSAFDSGSLCAARQAALCLQQYLPSRASSTFTRARASIRSCQGWRSHPTPS
jgi:hypothetical protein